MRIDPLDPEYMEIIEALAERLRILEAEHHTLKNDIASARQVRLLHMRGVV